MKQTAIFSSYLLAKINKYLGNQLQSILYFVVLLALIKSKINYGLSRKILAVMHGSLHTKHLKITKTSIIV